MIFFVLVRCMHLPDTNILYFLISNYFLDVEFLGMTIKPEKKGRKKRVVF